MRSFPALHFDVTKVSGVTDRTPEARLSFAYRSRKKCRWIAITFVTAVFLVSVDLNFDDILQRFIKYNKLNVSPRENVWFIGLTPTYL